MPSDFDVNQAAATVYAQSVLALAAGAGVEDAVAAELADLDELWRRSHEFAALLSSPAIDADARRESLRRIFAARLSPLTLNLLLVLNDKRRTAILPRVYETYRRLLEARRGEQRMIVTTARPLSDRQRATLLSHLRQITGRTPILVERIDESILGGLHVRMGDRVIDATVKRRLLRLAADLRATAEAHLHERPERFVAGT